MTKQDPSIFYVGANRLPHHYLGRAQRYPANLQRRAGHTAIPGREHHIRILHDDWCALFQDGACNCDPIRPLPGPPKARD